MGSRASKSSETTGAPAAVDEVPGHHGVLDVRFDRVISAQHGADAALGILRAALGRLLLGDDGHTAVLGHLEGVAQAGDAAPQHQEVHAACPGCLLQLGWRVDSRISAARGARPGAAARPLEGALRPLGGAGAQGCAPGAQLGGHMAGWKRPRDACVHLT